MGMANKLRDLIKKVDFFYSAQILRYEDQLQYKTLTGGFFSLCIITTICVAFFSMVAQTMNLEVFTTSVQKRKVADPLLSTISTNSDSNFMFAIEIWGLNLSATKRYFDIKLQSVGNQTTEIKLQTCTQKHWHKFPEILSTYNVGNWLCPPMNIQMNIQGKLGSKFYQRQTMWIQHCHNDTEVVNNSTCYSEDQIDGFFVQKKNFIGFSLFYSTPIINQNQRDYKSHYVEVQSYSFFGPLLGSENFLYFSQYSVTSDVSILPFQQITTDQGLFIESLPTKYPFQVYQEHEYFAIIHLVKSSNSFIYKRQAQKLSAVFSFIGGNIAAISGVLFIIKMYTEFAFSISLAYNLFEHQKKQGQQMIKNREKKINCLSFLRNAFYRIFRVFGCAVDNWGQEIYIQKCQQEINKQLDVKTLLRRLIFIQYCMTFILQDFQLQGLQLKQPRTAQQIRKIRQKCVSVAYFQEQSLSQLKQPKIQQPKQILVNNKKKSIMLELNDEISKHQDQSSKQCLPSKLLSTFKNMSKREMIAVQDIKSQVEDTGGSINNQIMNMCSIEEKKKQLMEKLKNNAKKGDRLSSRIWNKIDQSQRKSIKIE